MKTLEIYLDRASLPTIYQATEIISNGTNNRKLICWYRHPIKSTLILSKINACIFDQIDSLPEHLRKNHTKFDNIIIWGNLHWGCDIAKLLKILPKDKNIKLNLVNDGTFEYFEVKRFSHLPEYLQSRLMKQGKCDIDNYIYSPFKRLIYSIIGKKVKFSRKFHHILNWHNNFDTSYFLSRSEYFHKHLGNKSIFSSLMAKVNEIQWERIDSFTDIQIDNLLELLSIDKNQFEAIDTNCNILIGGHPTNQRESIESKIINDLLSSKGVLSKDLLYP